MIRPEAQPEYSHSPMPTQIRKRPRQQRSNASWLAILEAAAQLFQQHGLAGTSTNKVAARAGVSIGTLYQYFPNKEALLLALAEQHLSEAGAALQGCFEQLRRAPLDAAQTLDGLIDATVQLHRHQPQLHRLLFEFAPRSEALMQRLRALEQMLAAALAPELQRLGIAGEQPGLRALLIVQAVEAQVHAAVLSPPAPGSQACIAQIKSLWRRMAQAGALP